MPKQPSTTGTKRGGYRPGAGAKPGPGGTKLPVTVKLSPQIHEFFATLTESRGKFIERITVNSREFRQWRQLTADDVERACELLANPAPAGNPNFGPGYQKPKRKRK